METVNQKRKVDALIRFEEYEKNIHIRVKRYMIT